MLGRGDRWAAAVVWFLVVMVAWSRTATAHSTGMTAVEYPAFVPTGTVGCAAAAPCHTTPSGSAPTVAFQPMDPNLLGSLAANEFVMMPGQTTTFMLTITPAPNDTRTAAGFNVSAQTGTLSIPGGTNAERYAYVNGVELGPTPGNQITHSTPQNLGSSTEFSFLVQYQAPSTCGTDTLNLWGNIVNGASGSAGDHSAKAPPLTISTCGAGAACTSNSQCASSNCGLGFCCGPATCTEPDTCHTEACAAASSTTSASTWGQCGSTAKANGASCDDGNFCTTLDACKAGACVGGPAMVCKTPPDACTTSPGTCASNMCTYSTPAPQGTFCGSTTQNAACDGTGKCQTVTDPETVFVWGTQTLGELGDCKTGSFAASTPIPLGQACTTAAPTDFVDVQTGDGYSLGLMVDGSVWAWGENSSGQLGDGTVTTRTAPVRVSALSQVVTGISAYENHSVALIVNGSVYTWGFNDGYKLGSSNLPLGATSTPQAVSGITNAVAVAAGFDHTVVLDADGSVWTFGENATGQLGINSTNPMPYPVKVSVPATGAVRFKAIAAGRGHTLALGADGYMYSWGDNSQQQLGLTTGASPTQALIPTRSSIRNVRAIAAGYQTSFVITATGTLMACGANGSGQLGTGNTSVNSPPTDVYGVSSAISVSSKWYIGSAAQADGTVKAWGNGAPTPAAVSGLTNVVSVSSGYTVNTAVRALQNVVTWGNNSNNLIGDGKAYPNPGYVLTPTRITKPANLTTVKAISTSICGSHNLLLSGDGKVWAWGNNSRGQLGANAASAQASPVNVPGMPSVIAIAAGCEVSAALASNGTVYTWGSGDDGALGTGSAVDTPTPSPVPGLPAVIAISLRDQSALALLANGTLGVWGANAGGELGFTGASVEPTAAIVHVNPSRLVRAVATGLSTGYALLDDGTVSAWGYGTYGSIGNGATSGPAGPTVLPIANVSQLAAGEFTAFALAQGSVWGWGSNWDGELGLATPSYEVTPTEIESWDGFKQISAGAYTTCLLAYPGQGLVSGWGIDGALGTSNDSSATSWTTLETPGPTNDVEMGSSFGMAIVP